jgi:hypothetical protein
VIRTLARTLAVLIAAIPLIAGAGAVAAPTTPQPELVAASRCNGRAIDDDQTQIRDVERHLAGNDPNAIRAQLADLGDTLNGLSEEHNVLDHVCTSDNDKLPLFQQINAATASGILLQSELIAKLYVACPAAATAVPQALVAQAWLAVAATVNDANGTIPVIMAPVIPKVQARAAALNMTLPVYADTSAYWRDQFANAVTPAMQLCAGKLPTPPPTDAPEPVHTPNG